MALLGCFVLGVPLLRPIAAILALLALLWRGCAALPSCAYTIHTVLIQPYMWKLFHMLVLSPRAMLLWTPGNALFANFLCPFIQCALVMNARLTCACTAAQAKPFGPKKQTQLAGNLLNISIAIWERLACASKCPPLAPYASGLPTTSPLLSVNFRIFMYPPRRSTSQLQVRERNLKQLLFV